MEWIYKILLVSNVKSTFLAKELKISLKIPLWLLDVIGNLVLI